MKGFALPRPPDPRLGSLPNHSRHGRAFSRSALNLMLTPHRFSWASCDITSSFSSNLSLKSKPWKPFENSELPVIVPPPKCECWYLGARLYGPRSFGRLRPSPRCHRNITSQFRDTSPMLSRQEHFSKTVLQKATPLRALRTPWTLLLWMA